MKRVIVTITLSLIVANPVFALTYLGAPTTTMRAGQWSVGASYGDSEQDIELDRTIQFDDFDAESVLGRVGVGLADERMEIFGLFGLSYLEQNGVEADDDFIMGFGTRITATRGEDLDWGLVAQFLSFTADETTVIGGVETSYDLDLIDVQIGFGPCWRPRPFILYGGPMIHWIDGEIDTDVFGEFDVNTESWLGAYIGGGIDTEHLTVTVEIQATPDAWGWGAGAEFRF